jgi:hypothetical protein
MRADGVIMPAPALDQHLSLIERREDFPVQQLGLMAQAHQKMVYACEAVRFKFQAWKNR